MATRAPNDNRVNNDERHPQAVVGIVNGLILSAAIYAIVIPVAIALL